MFGLGKAYVLLGGPQQAIKPLTYAIAADDQNAEAYRLRAQAYAGVGKNDEANEDIQKSLSLDPDNYETYFALATILLREEKYPGSNRRPSKTRSNATSRRKTVPKSRSPRAT